MTAFTFTDTLSRVITSWGGTSMVMVRRLTLTILSTKGMRRMRPGPLPSPPGLTMAPACRPKRKITARSYSRRMRTEFSSTKRAIRTTGIRPSVHSSCMARRLLTGLGSVRGAAHREGEAVHRRHAHLLSGGNGAAVAHRPPDLPVDLHLSLRPQGRAGHREAPDHAGGARDGAPHHGAHARGDGPDHEAGGGADRGQDHRPRHAEA